jgi:septation ring formation regulator EzrA
MKEQLSVYFNRLETASSEEERQRVAEELQAYYATLTDEQLAEVKSMLKPDLNQFKKELAAVETAIEATFSRYFVGGLV